MLLDTSHGATFGKFLQLGTNVHSTAQEHANHVANRTMS